MKAGQAHQRDQASNQIDIFAMLGTPGKGAKKPGDVYPPVTEWSSQESLAFEKEALGFYITGHPLDKYDRAIKRITSGTIAALKEKAAAGEVRLGGVVSALKLRNTKKGDRYGNFNLEDKTGFIEVIAWPETYKKCAELLGADDPIFVKGRLEVGEDRMQVIANEITALGRSGEKSEKLAMAAARPTATARKFISTCASPKCPREELVRLRDTLLDYPGGPARVSPSAGSRPAAKPSSSSLTKCGSLRAPELEDDRGTAFRRTRQFPFTELLKHRYLHASSAKRTRRAGRRRAAVARPSGRPRIQPGGARTFGRNRRRDSARKVLSQQVKSITPATLIGRGKVEEIQKPCRELHADLVIIDEDLTPAQQRNLENGFQSSRHRPQPIDPRYFRPASAQQRRQTASRAGATGISFAAPDAPVDASCRGSAAASARAGPVKPSSKWTAGAFASASVILKRGSKPSSAPARLQRKERDEAPFATVALVGYTNAGKSTLMNTLTRAGVFVEDKLFATLDPTTRALRLPNGDKVMIVDTVGFINKIPHSLIEAFKSTLEEVSRCRFAAPSGRHVQSAATEEQIQVIEKVLHEIGAGEIPTMLVPNKIDVVAGVAGAPAQKRRRVEVCPISALTGSRRGPTARCHRRGSRSTKRRVSRLFFAGPGRTDRALARARPSRQGRSMMAI